MLRRRSKKPLVLHIGAGKCGSSSLQASLSAQPVLHGADGRTYEYFAIIGGGKVLRGNDITANARSSIHSYTSSIDLGAPQNAAHIAQGLKTILAFEGENIPLLSNEGWVNRPKVFAEEIIPHLGRCDIRAILYIRPPLDWLNSAWWQWGAWTGLDFETWATASSRHILWARLVRLWHEMDNVSQVDIRLATTDVVADLGGVLKADLPKAEIANSSSDRLYLRMLQRHRVLRPDPHQSALDFVFGKWAPGPKEPTPWVIPEDFGTQVLEKARPNYETLLRRVSPEIAQQIKDDPRWWSYEPYCDRQLEPAAPAPLTTKEYAEFSVRAAQGLINAVRKTPPED